MATAVPRAERNPIAPLFTENKRFRMIIEWALEGRGGDVIVDDPTNPNAALIIQRDLVLFGGNPDNALGLVDAIPSGCVEAICEDDRWCDLLSRAGCDLKPFTRMACSHESLDPNRLRTLAERVPEGFTVRRMNAELARRAKAEIDDWLLVGYDTPADLVADGLGWCALAGARPVSAATSIGTCARGIEIEIATVAEFQRRGLARAVAAHLILDSLERGLEPHWDAANHASACLAMSLGYALDSPRPAHTEFAPRTPERTRAQREFAGPYTAYEVERRAP